MKKIDYLIIFIFIFSYLILLYSFKKEIFDYRFSYETVKRYLCSQDIPYEPSCKRVIVSDEEIHIGAGYLYAKGEDPAVVNFQHMPFIALLYGLISIYLKNPYLLELFFGVIYLILVYYLGIKIFQKRIVSILTILILLIDPLFIDISSQASYELGQAVFNLLYFLSLFIWKNWFLAGIFLAMFAGSKFYGAVIFFAFIYHFYLYLKREFNWKKFVYHLILAFCVFNLFYINSYLKQGLNFNIFIFQLKVIKFWMSHSITNLPFASVLLFMFGIFKKWWEDYRFIFSHIYSILWPISLFSSIYLLKIIFNKNKKKSLLLTKKFNSTFYVVAFKIGYLVKKLSENLNLKILIYLISPLYLLYLGTQAPFVRYFIIILPFSYLSLSYFIYLKIILKNN